jgi:glyoxylase-like metal-dependent hydrolase (beta-lactamase superfamily II)
VPGNIRVGNVDIVAVLDMVPPPREPSMMFPTTSSQDWESHQDALEEGQLQLYYLHFFLRSQGKTIMVDTGMGPGPHPDRGNRTGDLINQLKIKGVDTGDVDIVAHTHLHGDHVGWNIDNTDSQPAPTFPKARYLVPRLDWEHFTQPDVIGTAPQVTNSVIPLQGMGLMDLVDSEHNITDEVKTLSTPGHTPGHMVIVITSQGEKAMVVGDLLHNKAQVERPDWTAGVDTDKDSSRRNRENILDQAEEEGYVIAAGHFHPNDHIGKVVRLEGKRFWQIL